MNRISKIRAHAALATAGASASTAPLEPATAPGAAPVPVQAPRAPTPRVREPSAVTGARLYDLLTRDVLPVNAIAKRLGVPERRVRTLCRQLRSHDLLRAISISVRGLPSVTYYCVLSEHNVAFLHGTGGS